MVTELKLKNIRTNISKAQIKLNKMFIINKLQGGKVCWLWIEPC